MRLDSQGVFRRFVRLWIAGLVLLFMAWFAGYFLIPQGLLRDVFVSSRLPLEAAGPTGLVARIILYNGVIASGLIALANLFRVGDFPLGYLPVLIYWALYGIFLGSDSFSHSLGARLFPSFAVLLGRSGVYEMTGYTLVASATAILNLYRQKSWTDWTTVRERRWRELRLGRSEWLAVGFAALLILFGGIREGAGIASLLP